MTALLEVRHLSKDFLRSGRLFSRAPMIRAVDDVTFSIGAGEMFGLVGESGSGKTTIGRCVLRLIEPTAGEICFQGVDLCQLRSAALRSMRRHMQIVFQDPYSSLNPRMRAGAIVAEPLEIHRQGSADERQARVRELFERVGLDAAMVRRFPHEFSGGQRQRIAIARALALNPSFIVADEPVSALDAPIQRQIVALMTDLQTQLGLAYLFITHDLRLASRIAARVAVMYRGRIVELGTPDRLFAEPAHPYTQALLSSMPGLTGTCRPRVRYDPQTFERRPLIDVGGGHLAAV